MDENFTPVFEYKINFSNSKYENTNSKDGFVFKNRFYM